MKDSTFLGKFADELVNRHGKNMSDVIVVVPGQRAAHRLKQELAARAGVSWIPTAVTFPGFISIITGYSSASQIDLFFGLYSGLQELEGKNVVPFDQFLEWSGIVLSDFNDIEQYLLEAKQVFRNLEDYEEIEKWSFSQKDLSPQQEEFSGFWKGMGELFEKFNAWQNEHGKFSYAHLLRKVCDNPGVYLSAISGRQIYFSGVHALSGGEERLAHLLKKDYGAQLFLDADVMYCDDIRDHEAGNLIRKLRNSGFDKWFGEYFRNGRKEINIAAAKTGMGQVWGAVQFYEKRSENNCVVVLNDEKLAAPLCEAFESKGIAVSYHGISAKQSVVYGLLERWMKIWIHAENYGITSGFSTKDVLHLFSNPVVQFTNPGLSSEFLNWITKKNLSTLNIGSAKEFLAEQSENIWVKRFVHDKIPSMKDWISEVRGVLAIAMGSKDISSGLRDELTVADDWMRQAEDWILILALNFKSMHRLIGLCASSTNIRSSVSEAGALQIMGLLETRAIDFDHVIMLGTDEKNLPGSASYNSFIPHDIRIRYKLPVQHDRESLYAYNFYRLMQRVETADLFYSLSSDDFNQTEPSRFLAQIINELPAYNPEIRIQKFRLNTAGVGALESKSHANNDFVRNRMKELFETGVSPSALNTFNRCPLDFYYKYVVGLSEREEVDENIDSAVFGQIVHKVLEDFYTGFSGTFPSQSDLENLRKNAALRVRECLSHPEFRKYSWTGENALALEIATVMVERYVAEEEKNLKEEPDVKRRIEEIESKLGCTVDASRTGWINELKLTGKADRIEDHGGKTRILDYKTGRVRPQDLGRPKNPEQIFTSSKRSKLLQLLIYKFIYCKMNPADPRNVVPGIFSFPNFREGVMWLENQKEDSTEGEEWMLKMENDLLNLVDRIYKTEVFVHNPDSQFCSYCNG